jgi:hypothetical protein
MPTESLLTLSPIALTGENVIYLSAGVVAGSLLTLTIFVAIFAAVYMPKEDDN